MTKSTVLWTAESVSIKPLCPPHPVTHHVSVSPRPAAVNPDLPGPAWLGSACRQPGRAEEGAGRPGGAEGRETRRVCSQYIF